jgi:hypothetical protein
LGSRSRDDEARARLEPLGPGERPLAVTVAAIVAGVIALANLALFAGGYELRDEETSPGGVIVFSGVMLVAAVFMWRRAYWAVLGFQALLAISCVIAGLSLLFASNVQGALLALAVMSGSGVLFWFLIRAMARIQMPSRPGRGPGASVPPDG